VLHGDWAEVKRMWTDGTARGRGVARAILAALEAAARTHGVAMLRLETGVDSHAALALYRSAGFVETGPFADYAPDPLSVFMERRLGP
jgi:putative acetyltransferase